MAGTPAMMEPTFDVDKLSYEIFSILESKFLFGYDDPKLFVTAGSSPETPAKPPATTPRYSAGKVRILSIDGGNGLSDGLLAGVSLARLEASLQMRSGDPAARIADFFDVAAGSGAGGVLAAMLFTRGPDGRPLFSSEEALWFLAKNRRGLLPSTRKGLFRGMFTRSGKTFHRIFGDATLRDTLKPVLIPCYDLSTGAPFLFSRADAVETDGYDFQMKEVCAATCADPDMGAGVVEMRSLDRRTRIVAVGGGLATANPTAAAITHVLNNKQEFPFAAGLDDLLVVSLGSGEVNSGWREAATPSTAELVRIAGNGVSDTVDQAVAMAFGENRTSNYVRIQANGFFSERTQTSKSTTSDARKMVGAAEEILGQRNVESVLFRGKKISEHTNADKLELLSGELIKEQERRKASPIPQVLIKQTMTPRTSSATTGTTISTTTSTGNSSPPL